MLENIFTTKMSMDKKILQQRFLKIRSKSSIASRLMSIIIFFAVIILIVSSAIYIAVKKNNEYIMSDKDFISYTRRPIGAIMADIDYVDDEKIVFHYLEGFFITNEKTMEIEHKIDLRKLNSALDVQGDTTLRIKIDKNGNFAYLSSDGAYEEANKFEKYIIDLNSGEIKKGEMPKDTELFSNYINTDTIASVDGWHSTSAVWHNDKTYYLNFPYGTIGNIQLVTIANNPKKPLGVRYIFGEIFADPAPIKEKVYKNFEMSDFTGMKDVLLEISGNEYALTDFKDLLTVEKIMSKAKIIKGGTKCSFDAKLIIKNQAGEYSKIELATDSCAVFRINDVYYDYSDGDNSTLYSLFGISSKELRTLFREV